MSIGNLKGPHSSLALQISATRRTAHWGPDPSRNAHMIFPRRDADAGDGQSCVHAGELTSFGRDVVGRAHMHTAQTAASETLFAVLPIKAHENDQPRLC